MIKILSITVYDANNSDRIHYESFKDKQFDSQTSLLGWVHWIERVWTEIKGFDCKAYTIRRSKPKVELDKNNVLINTAIVMGVNIDDVLSQSRKRIHVDVRKTACMILIDADYMPREIEKELPFKNRIIYTYREKMEDRLATEPGYEAKYEEIRRKVMDMTTNLKSVNDKIQNHLMKTK